MYLKARRKGTDASSRDFGGTSAWFLKGSFVPARSETWGC